MPLREQLQRLYGTAFFDQKALDAHMKQVEEAKIGTTASSAGS